jgi:hypothetical protein
MEYTLGFHIADFPIELEYVHNSVFCHEVKIPSELEDGSELDIYLLPTRYK